MDFDFETLFKIAKDEPYIPFTILLKRSGFKPAPLAIPLAQQFFLFRTYSENGDVYYFSVMTTGHCEVDPTTFEKTALYCRTRIILLNYPYYVVYDNGVEAWNDIVQWIEDNSNKSIIDTTHGLITYQQPFPNS
jgi:hypothetical protein